MRKKTRFLRPVSVIFLPVVMFVSSLSFPVSGALALTPDPSSIMGFTADKAAVERQWEAVFKSVPDPVEAEANTTALSEHPIMYATAWDWWNVQYSMEKLRSYGVNPEIKTYYPYGSWPGTVSVEMVAPLQMTLKVKEDGGFSWEKYWDDVPIGFNAYSPNGDVTAEVVYANYGGAADYATLEQMGVDVKGKIVIVRYGGPARGAKQAQAALHGAAGVLLYDDPVEDGCIRGAVFPTGPWRPADSIQRGSVMYIWEYPGDPLTPGWSATKNAHRLSPAEAANLPKGAPVTPLGYGPVSSLLATLGGLPAPPDWQGGLGDGRCTSLPGVTPVPVYRVGPGPTKVHLKVDLQTGIKPIWDIMVQIPGTKHPEQMVVLAGHRDGWAYGSSDSTAGFTVIMEMARGFGELLRRGWRPERTIVLGGWDAEEPFELGSVEWVEELQQQLGKSAVAYVNLDGAGGGVNFGSSAVPALDDFIYEVTKDVIEPRNGKTVYDDWVERRGGPRPPIGRFGGGSDYSPFINYIGMATMSFSFSSSTGGYHSAYDDLYMMANFGDPGYRHHVTAAQLAGLIAMRLANADILPFRYSQYATAVSGYLNNLNKLQVQLYGKEVVSLDREMEQSQAWQQASAAAEGKIDSILASNSAGIPPGLVGQVEFINDKLIRQERDLTQAKGVPGRPWFKHMIYATAVYQGYAVQYLPALADMVTAGDWAKVRNYKALLHNSLTTATNTAKTAAIAK